MKKLLVIIALTVSLGIVAGLYAQPASAFFNLNMPFFGSGAKACNAPVCAPPCYGYYCGPVYTCKPMKAKAKVKGEAKEKKVKKEKKEKKGTK